jgi:hypothetical protein
MMRSGAGRQKGQAVSQESVPAGVVIRTLSRTAPDVRSLRPLVGWYQDLRNSNSIRGCIQEPSQSAEGIAEVLVTCRLSAN